MAAVGDKIVILPRWGEGRFFKSGDEGVLTWLGGDGDWWADFGQFTDRCVGTEGLCFKVTEVAALSDVTQLQARVAELEGALTRALAEAVADDLDDWYRNAGEVLNRA